MLFSIRESNLEFFIFQVFRSYENFALQILFFAFFPKRARFKFLLLVIF